MSKQRIEVMPCKSFKERVATVRKLEIEGITPEHLGNNLLYINYNIKGGVMI